MRCVANFNFKMRRAVQHCTRGQASWSEPLLSRRRARETRGGHRRPMNQQTTPLPYQLDVTPTRWRRASGS